MDCEERSCSMALLSSIANLSVWLVEAVCSSMRIRPTLSAANENKSSEDLGELPALSQAGLTCSHPDPKKSSKKGHPAVFSILHTVPRWRHSVHFSFVPDGSTLLNVPLKKIFGNRWGSSQAEGEMRVGGRRKRRRRGGCKSGVCKEKQNENLQTFFTFNKKRQQFSFRQRKEGRCMCVLGGGDVGEETGKWGYREEVKVKWD